MATSDSSSCLSSSGASCSDCASFRVRPASPAHVPRDSSVRGCLPGTPYWFRAHAADLHAGPVLTGPLLTRPCFFGNAHRSAADRAPPPCWLRYLSTPLHRAPTMAPGVLETCAASPFISRSCTPVLCPGQEVPNKEVLRRAVDRTGR